MHAWNTLKSLGAWRRGNDQGKEPHERHTSISKKAGTRSERQEKKRWKTKLMGTNLGILLGGNEAPTDDHGQKPKGRKALEGSVVGSWLLFLAGSLKRFASERPMFSD